MMLRSIGHKGGSVWRVAALAVLAAAALLLLHDAPNAAWAQDPQSSDATLSELTIANATTGSDASAGPVWPFGDRSYAAAMLQEVTSVTVRPTATAGDRATVTVQLESGGTPQTMASGADSAAIAITPHANPDDPHNIIINVTAENGDTLTYTLRVYQYPPVSFDATVPALTFTQGVRVEHGPLPSGSDHYEVTYTATGLPAGLSLSSVHRAIVGTPTTVTAAPATVTYTAAGEFGSTASLTFDVSVASPVTFDEAARTFCSSRIVAFTGDEEWLDAGDDGTVTYPAASGGAGTLTYSLIESDSQQPLSSVASGITFDPATRKLGGTPSQEARRQWSVTYAAVDQNGSRAACTTAVHAGGFGGL